MQISLKQTEIEQAVKDYVVKLGFNLDNKEVDVQFTNGRGENGVSVQLEIVPLGTPIQPQLKLNEEVIEVSNEESVETRKEESKGLFS